jgi:hypothetical protein
MAGVNPGGAISSAGTAANDLIQGQATEEADTLKAQGDEAEAAQYKIADQELITETGVKEAQASRNLTLAQGQTEQEIAGSGGKNSGNALDIMRSNAEQGALQQQVLSQSGMSQEEALVTEEDAANNAAQSEMKMADQARTNSYITAGIAGLSAIASMIPVA